MQMVYGLEVNSGNKKWSRWPEIVSGGRAFWYWAIAFGILIPMSIDNLWSLDWRSYTFRSNYLFVLILGCCFLGNLVLGAAPARAQFKSWFTQGTCWAWIGMLAVGLIGLSISEHPKRTVVFLIWSACTFLGIPLLNRFLFSKIPLRSFLNVFSIYCLFQASLILLDGLLCWMSNGAEFIGRVMIYTAPGRNLCRPHAFYQEPGYYCGFAALAWVLIWLSWRKDLGLSKTWVRIRLLTLGLLGVSTIVTTSRLGLIVFFAISLLLGSAWIIDQWKSRRILRLAWVGVAVVLGGWSFGKMTGHFPGPVYDHFIRAIFQPGGDGSIGYRSLRIQASFDVFKESPWVGVGPGGAGAYLVEHFPNHPVFLGRFAEEATVFRSDPLAMSYYLELLTDWGLVGSFLFILGFVLWFRDFTRFERTLIFATFALIAITGQTLQRFDFWWVLALIHCCAGRQEWKISPIKSTL